MDGINFFDSTLMTFIQGNLHNSVTEAFFSAITFFGEAGVFWIVLSLGLVVFQKTRRCGIAALCTLAVGFLFGELILKNIVCRPRPYQDFPEYVRLLLPEPGGYSFPSGHTVSSFGAAYVFYKHSRKWGIPALILASLIGFSRVFLFFHWPTDVIGGILFGIAAANFVLWLLPQIRQSRLETEKALNEDIE